MIKWQANFQIEDATVQMAEAYIRVIEFKNSGGKCTAKFLVGDETGNIIVKEYTKTFNITFADEADVYAAELLEYDPAEIV